MTKREIDICICTFQREHILETLKSIDQMNMDPNWFLRVIVADNDETPSSKEAVEAFAQNLSFPVTYTHAPARNISIARNACLNESKAALVAFIDDDEIADKKWLKEMLSKIDASKADAVLGHVKAIYLEDCPQWIIDGDFYSHSATYVRGEITTGYSGNLLLNQISEPFKGRRFSLELGQTGGEDSSFLKNAYRAGAKIEYAPNAIVSEIIPSERTTLSWLLRRRFRAGQTHGMMLEETTGKSFSAKVKNILLASAKSCISISAAPFFILKKHRFYFWICRAVMHAGVVAHLIGKATLVQYGQDSKEPSKSH